MRDDMQWIDLTTAAQLLGKGVTTAHVQARLRRGSLQGEHIPGEGWRVLVSDLRRVLEAVEPCQTCGVPALYFVIIKYHHHVRLEFAVCEFHAQATAAAYSAKGGVIELSFWPLLSEGWLKAMT